MPNESGKQPAEQHKKHVARLERERRQSRMILYAFIGILAAVILLLGYGYLYESYIKLRQPVAKVGEEEILLKDFQARVRLQRRQMLLQYSQLASTYSQYQQFAQATGMDVAAQLSQIEAQAQQLQSELDAPQIVGQTVLDQMINEELIRQEARKRGITVEEEELSRKIQAEFGYFPNGTQTPTVTPTANPLLELPPVTPSLTPTPTGTILPPTPTVQPSATPTLSATSTPQPTATPITLEAYEKLYQDSRDDMAKLGFDYDIYRSYYEMQILQEKLLEVIGKDAKPEEEQIRARHILVSDEALAKELIKRLQQGENFGLLAMEYSTDKSNSPQGGDLGWFGKGKMVAEFEAAAFALQNPGDFTTEPVKTEFGYHVIQLIDRPYSPDQIEAAKYAAFTAWLEKAKTDYGVQTFDEIWQGNIPVEPNQNTMATEAAYAQETSIAKEKESAKNAGATPTP